jgi:hypothetical protein
VPQDRFDDRVLALLVARHLDLDPDGVRLRRSPTGKFNETCLVEGGPVPLVLRVAPPDDRPRMLFYEHRMTRQEPAQHALRRDRTDAPVPAIVAHDFGHTEIDRDYLLMRFSQWKRPAVRLPWRRDVLEADLATYAARGIRHVTSFAVYVDADYRRRYGEPEFIREYGEALGELRRQG